uniref:Uncharacterized protein n=1 Tax=Romanomermis culicivorax TaxID=13658 RepID=A0A915L952_ROMCU
MSKLMREKRRKNITSKSIGRQKTDTLTSSSDPRSDVSDDLGEYRLVGHAIVEGKSLPPIIEQLKDKRMRIDICSSKVKLSQSRKVHRKKKQRKKKRIDTRGPEQKSSKSESGKPSVQKVTTSFKTVARKSSRKSSSRKIIKTQEGPELKPESPARNTGFGPAESPKSKPKTSSKKKKRNKSLLTTINCSTNERIICNNLGTSKKCSRAEPRRNQDKKSIEKSNKESQQLAFRASKLSQVVQNSDVLAAAGIKTPVAYFKRVVSDEQSSSAPKTRRSTAILKHCDCFGGQVYDELRKLCKREKILFEDPYFPAQDSSISIKDLSYEVQWLRPASGAIKVCKIRK